MLEDRFTEFNDHQLEKYYEHVIELWNAEVLEFVRTCHSIQNEIYRRQAVAAAKEGVKK